MTFQWYKTNNTIATSLVKSNYRQVNYIYKSHLWGITNIVTNVHNSTSSHSHARTHTSTPTNTPPHTHSSKQASTYIQIHTNESRLHPACPTCQPCTLVQKQPWSLSITVTSLHSCYSLSPRMRKVSVLCPFLAIIPFCVFVDNSISALQWLCNADKKHHKPAKRLYTFFSTLYACLVSRDVIWKQNATFHADRCLKEMWQKNQQNMHLFMNWFLDFCGDGDWVIWFVDFFVNIIYKIWCSIKVSVPVHWWKVMYKKKMYKKFKQWMGVCVVCGFIIILQSVINPDLQVLTFMTRKKKKDLLLDAGM